MSAEAQARLLAYVEEGGHLVFFQALPTQDENLKPLNMLGLPAPDGVLDGGKFELVWDNERVTVQSGSLFTFGARPESTESGTPIRAHRLHNDTQYLAEENIHHALPVGATYTAGFHWQRGRGTITVLGMTPNPEIVRALHRWLDVPVASHASVSGVITALFEHEDGTHILIVVNNGDSDQHAQIMLDASIFEAGVYHINDLYRGADQQVSLNQSPAIPVYIPAKSGTVLRIQPV